VPAAGFVCWRGAEGNRVKDPEYGKDVPSDGAREPRGDAGKRHSRPPPAGRNAPVQPQANGRPDDKTGENPGKSRKRRKRKRGRKVFARDDATQNKPAPLEAPQPVKIAPVPTPAPVASRFNGRDAVGGEAPVYAALDLGTNNCRLLVAIPGKGGQFRVVDAFSRIVRLGEGLTASGRLSDAAMDRAVEALKVAWKAGDTWGVVAHLGEAAICAILQVLAGGTGI